MEIDVKDVSPAVFINAVTHLRSIGASSLVVFKERRQTEGWWLVAYIIIDGQRYVRWTGEAWREKTLDEQAVGLSEQLAIFQR